MIRKKLMFTLIILICIVSSLNNSTTNLCFTANNKIRNQNPKFNLDLKLEIISPLNNTTYYPRPDNPLRLIYTIQPQGANISIWLNGSLVVNKGNFTILPVFFRTNYNLTMKADYLNYSTIKKTFFKALGPLGVQFEFKFKPYNSSMFVQDNNMGYKYPFYIYAPNVTIPIFIKFSEFSPNFFLRLETDREIIPIKSNYTWWNSSTILLCLDPLVSFYERDPLIDEWRFNPFPDDGFSYYILTVILNSTLVEGEQTKSICKISRDFYSPYIDIFLSNQDFLILYQKGTVTVNFNLLDSSPLIYETFLIDLDGEKLQETEYMIIKIQDNQYTLSINLDTAKYSDGVHSLHIQIKDFYNHSSEKYFIFTIDNKSATLTPNKSNIGLLAVIIAIPVLGLLKKQRHKKVI
ncbi:MAG: hypothetical protein ACTSUR_03450 [Candidatus Heimdallarchaeaceae archaeon]